MIQPPTVDRITDLPKTTYLTPINVNVSLVLWEKFITRCCHWL